MTVSPQWHKGTEESNNWCRKSHHQVFHLIGAQCTIYMQSTQEVVFVAVPEGMLSDSELAPETRAPRRGSTLEGRVKALLGRRGFRSVTNRVVLDHEFDVWAEDRDGRVVVAECKEYYDSGPATPAHIRNFFGKIYDIEKNYGTDVYMSLFVCISGFTDAARSLSERLGVMSLDLSALEMLESSEEELTPRYLPREDSTVLELRKKSERLREELNRRQLVRRLSERIEEYQRTLQTRTIPSFLVPSSTGRSFWFSKCHDIPVVGIDGAFDDYVVSSFPQIDGLCFTKRRFLGRKRVAVPVALFQMDSGVIHLVGKEALASDPTLETAPSLSELQGLPVHTLDNTSIGTAVDFLVSFGKDRPQVESILVQASSSLRDRLAETEFAIPGERISLKESDGSVGEAKVLIAHVRLSEQILSSHRVGD